MVNRVLSAVHLGTLMTNVVYQSLTTSNQELEEETINKSEGATI